jgi:hypothetical protein
MGKLLRRCTWLIVVFVLAGLPLAVGEPASAADWIPLGGPYAAATPEVRPSGDLLAQVAQDGGAWVHERRGAGWSPPLNAGGFFRSTVVPASAISGAQPADPALFGIGLDGAMWWRRAGTSWQSLGGQFVLSPKPVFWQGVTYVFGIGIDNGVWYRSLSSPWIPLGGAITTDLAVTADAHSLWVIGGGIDGSMWSIPLTGLTWGHWRSLHGVATSYPAATFLFDAGYLFIVGLDDAVWYTRIKGGEWLGWSSLGGIALSAPAAAEDPNGGIDVFIVGADLAMYMRRLNASGWTEWTHLGGAFTSAPGASSTQAFGIGLDGWLYAANYPNR